MFCTLVLTLGIIAFALTRLLRARDLSLIIDEFFVLVLLTKAFVINKHRSRTSHICRDVHPGVFHLALIIADLLGSHPIHGRHLPQHRYGGLVPTDSIRRACR